jgi:hypothetical protein
LTTNRPYQHAHTPEEAFKIIQNLAGKRLDPVPVAALMAVYGRGEIRIQRIAVKRPAVADAAANVLPATPAPALPATEPANLEGTPV